MMGVMIELGVRGARNVGVYKEVRQQWYNLDRDNVLAPKMLGRG